MELEQTPRPYQPRAKLKTPLVESTTILVSNSHPHLKAYLALAAVCFFWGTTYLGIRVALESFPAILLVPLRFITSGSILLLAALARGSRFPRGRELVTACLSGILILGVGNGTLAWAEELIPSGLAGLIITISPFWLVGIEALMGGERPSPPVLLGMFVGLLGAALLIGPDVLGITPDRNVLKGFLLLQLGNASWCFGSLWQRRQNVEAHPFVVGAVQQMAAGLSFLPFLWLAPTHAIHWNLRGVSAVLYLVVFGSIVGYSAYAYALDRLPVAVVSVYPYVNAVVAVTLGWLFYREPFGPREALAMAVIFLGVGIVKWHNRTTRVRQRNPEN